MYALLENLKTMKKILLLHLSLFLFISCSSQQKINLSQYTNDGNSFVIWSLSDLQPRDESEYFHFERAVADVNKNIPGVDIAIVAGDILQDRKRTRVFDWYNRIKAKSYIKAWFEIAGNHDGKNLMEYRKKINPVLNYSRQYGNILFLFMSDMSGKPPQMIPDDVFMWWKKMVIENQDKIIITVSHAYVKKSKLALSFYSTRNITDSDRFAKVLKKYRVDIWIAGHAHVPDFLPGKIRVSEELNNTLFINTGVIREDPFISSTSRFLFFRNGSDKVLIRIRFHAKQKFDKDRDYEHILKCPVRKQ